MLKNDRVPLLGQVVGIHLHQVKQFIVVGSGEKSSNDYSNQFEQTPFILASLKTTP